MCEMTSLTRACIIGGFVGNLLGCIIIILAMGGIPFFSIPGALVTGTLLLIEWATRGTVPAKSVTEADYIEARENGMLRAFDEYEAQCDAEERGDRLFDFEVAHVDTHQRYLRNRLAMQTAMQRSSWS